MIELKEGYKNIYCPIHQNKKLGQVREDSKQDGEVLVYCKLCKHEVPVKNIPVKK